MVVNLKHRPTTSFSQLSNLAQAPRSCKKLLHKAPRHHPRPKVMCVLSHLSCFQKLMCVFSATPWTVACQAPLPTEFPRQEYWNGLPFHSPGDLPNPGINPVTPALAGRFFTAEPPGKPKVKALFISHDHTAASTDTHTPCPGFSAWKLFPNVSEKVLVQELYPRPAPAPKLCSRATVPGLENPTQVPSVQMLYLHPLSSL